MYELIEDITEVNPPVFSNLEELADLKVKKIKFLDMSQTTV